MVVTPLDMNLESTDSEYKKVYNFLQTEKVGGI